MDYLLSAITIISFILIGRKNYWGFVLSVANGVLWIIYGITIHQYGLIPSSIFLMAVNARNAIVWRKEELHANIG